MVAVYDQGRDGDLVFLVMELVDGGTLRDLLRERGSLSVPVTMSILEPLLAALGAAHAAGLVHRDVKPENVLISSKGAVKIADFGLVRAVTSQTMATGDVILGTVAYLSPEQVSTGAADASSDVYAAGIVAYEMLTGRPPYRRRQPDVGGLPARAFRRAAAVRSAPGTPEALDELIVAATRRDPAARPQGRLGLPVRAGRDPRHGPAPGSGSGAAPAPPTRRAAPAVAAPVARAGPAAAGPVTVANPHPVPVLRRGRWRWPTHRASSGNPPAARTAREPPPPRARRPPAHRREHRRTRSGDDPARPPPARCAARRRRWLIAILVVVLLAVSAAAGGWWLAGRWSATPARSA